MSDQVEAIKRRDRQSRDDWGDEWSDDQERVDRATLLAEVERQRTAHLDQLIKAHDMAVELRDEFERLRAEVERLREIIRTMRARCVELDDSDAVSAVMDIASSVLEGAP